MEANSYEKLASTTAVVAGAASFLYAVAFIIIAKNNPPFGGVLSDMFLLIVGLSALPTFVALYHRLVSVNTGFAHLALLFGVISAAGMLLHGGYDLANAINPPAGNAPSLANLPSQVDPRGLLSFGLASLSLLITARLMAFSGQFPKNLVWLGYLSSFLLGVLYLGRLLILTPTSPIILWPALVNGFIVGPAWYIWIGMLLKKPVK